MDGVKEMLKRGIGGWSDYRGENLKIRNEGSDLGFGRCVS